MADYKEIKGKHILSIASDLDSSAGEGQIWFNTTSGDLKTIIGIGSWSTGGNVNTQRYALAGAGTQTAAWMASGYAPTDAPVSNRHEQYDGSTWTEAADVNTARFHMYSGTGSTTAALFTGGTKDPGTTGETESWNGSSCVEFKQLD